MLFHCCLNAFMMLFFSMPCGSPRLLGRELLIELQLDILSSTFAWLLDHLLVTGGCPRIIRPTYFEGLYLRQLSQS
jgi:hypothetical protein